MSFAATGTPADEIEPPLDEAIEPTSDDEADGEDDGADAVVIRTAAS